MTRDDAVRQVHARITKLPSKSDRASARAALAQLLRDVDRAARKHVLEADRKGLLTVLPELKLAVDRIIAELALLPAAPPGSRK